MPDRTTAAPRSVPNLVQTGFLFMLSVLSGTGCVSKDCPLGAKHLEGKCTTSAVGADAGAAGSAAANGSGGKGASGNSGASGSQDAPGDASAVDGKQAGQPAVADAGVLADQGEPNGEDGGVQPPPSPAPCNGSASVTCWRDGDGDGFAGGAALPTLQCGTSCDTGFTALEPTGGAIDCDDGSSGVHPMPCWPDADRDGYAASDAQMVLQCRACGTGFVSQAPQTTMFDCNDASASVNSGAIERCNGIDDDCDGQVDENASSACTLPGATSECSSAGTCSVKTCDTGRADCDATATNGCEQALNVSGHCGGCGITCHELGTCNAQNPKGVCECFAPAFGTGTDCSGPGPLAAGGYDTCVIGSDLVAQCIGFYSVSGFSNVRQLAASSAEMCAVDFQGAIHCRVSSSLPSGDFIQTVVGNVHACALGYDLHAKCWGPSSDGSIASQNDVGQLGVPSGQTFRQLAAGAYHTCGIRMDGTVACWGGGTSTTKCDTMSCGQSLPPSGKFVQISAGQLHTCGLREDGTVQCWGAGQTNNGKQPQCGQSLAPSDAMTWITAGAFHTCAIRKSDGQAVCWGAGDGVHTTDFDHGQATPLPGAFTRLAAGMQHTCGLTASGAVICWGDNGFKQAPAELPGPFPLIPKKP
jgi:alpha-tubulin suppressor-like RCC1 family protein